MKINDTIPNRYASAAMPLYSRVNFDGSGDVQLAGATDAEVGTLAEIAFKAGDPASVHTATPGCTYFMIAAGAFARDAVVYGAANGQIDDVSNANRIGIALDAATAAGDVVRVLRQYDPTA